MPSLLPKIEDQPMSLVGHLDELRSRVLWSVAAWVAAGIAAYRLAPTMLDRARPLLGTAKLIFTNPTEPFFAYMKVGMIGGLFIASPIIFYHVLMFILPGLEPRERRWFIGLLPVAVVLFITGVAFSFEFVLPVTMKFFLSFQMPGLDANIKLEEFMGFLLNIAVVCGIIFQLPLVLLFAALIGLVSSKMLRAQRRIAYFSAFVISAVVTPTPDAFTATIVALPMIVLFEISLLIIRIIGK